MSAPRDRFPLLYLAPAFVLIVLVWGAPLVYTVALSVTNASPGSPGVFVGADNFRRIPADPRFIGSLATSAVYAGGVVVLNIALGFAIAIALRTRPLARAVAQSALVFPWVLSELAAALIWSAFLGENNGLLNIALGGVGLPAFHYRMSAWGAMSALWLASLWRGLAFSAMLQMGGLASLPSVLIQAARLDGASRPQILRSVVIPHLSRTIMVNAALVFLMTAASFSLPFALTRGGPLFATELIALYAYNTAFGGAFELGYSAAMGLVVFALYAAAAAAATALRRRSA